MKNPFANLFKKKDAAVPEITPSAGGKIKKESFFSKFIKNKLGKSSIKGEEIVGVDYLLTKLDWLKFQATKQTNGF